MMPAWILLLCVWSQVVRKGDLLVLQAGDHEFSRWNATENRPSDGCYTMALYDAYRLLSDTCTGRVAIMGLGAGVLPARMARDGVRSRVIELDEDIIRVYDGAFRERMDDWSRNPGHMTITNEDALTGEYEEEECLLIIDIPPCYRDFSKGCERMLHRLGHKTVVMNVWYTREDEVLQAVGGRIILRHGTGVVVWTNA